MNSRNDTSMLLQACQRLYETVGIPGRLAESAEDTAYSSLVLSFDAIGRFNRSVKTELNRIPGLEAEQEGIHILQIFASSLDLNRNDRESEPSYPPDLYRTVNRLNVSLPLGAFGLMEDEAVLFYKLNVLLDLKQDLGWNTQLIDRNIGLLLHIHDVFIDTLEEVATGKLSYDSAISRLRLP